MDQQEYLERVGRECEKKLRGIGIPVGEIDRWEVDRKRRSRWGNARKFGFERGFVISINQRLLEGHTQAGLEETVMHELLHTCPGCMNHKAKWKHYAALVNAAFHLNITTFSPPEKKGLPEDPAKYVVRCTECGMDFPRKRMCKIVRHPEAYVCSRCGGRLTVQTPVS